MAEFDISWLKVLILIKIKRFKAGKYLFPLNKHYLKYFSALVTEIA